MTRIRWFRLEISSNLEKLSVQLMKKTFRISDPASSGFKIDPISPTRISGQYVSKRTFDQLILMPNGEEFSQELVSIEIVNFSVEESQGHTFLAVYEAPRSLTGFLGALSEATKFSCVVEAIEVDIRQLLTRLENSLDSAALNYLEVSQLEFPGKVQGRIVLAGSGPIERNVSSIRRLASGGVVESAKILIQDEGVSVSVYVNRRGGIRLPANVSPFTMRLLSSELLASSR